MSTSFQPFVRLLGGLTLLSGLASFGCGSDETTLDVDPGTPRNGSDAGPGADASSVADANAIPAPRAPADLWLSSGRGQESFDSLSEGDAASCFDGVDNDAASDVIEGVDCSDPDCQELATCCVNDASCAAPPQRVFENDFEACTHVFCDGEFTIFGGVGEVPVFDDGTLALMGDAVFDTGWFGNESLDLRSDRIDLEVTFVLGGCDECRETAAVGLSAQPQPGASSVITPLVALRGVAAQQEVQLIIHDRVVAVYPAGDQSLPWRLSVRPDGEVEMRHGDVVERKRYVPSAEAHLILYGNSVNPGEGIAGARIDAIKVERLETDRVDAWGVARSLEHPGGRVSAARLDGEDYLALSDDEGVLFYKASDNTLLPWVFAEGWDAHVDYALAELEGVLTVIAVNPDGALVRGAVDLATREIAAPTTVLDPLSVGWSDIRHPSIIRSNGLAIVIAAVGGALQAAVEVDGRWTPFGGGLGERSAGAEYPSLVVHGSVYWLHYSVRTGTRERVRVLVSDQMFHWRDLGDALAGSGISESVDRFSTSSPALVSDGDVLRMYFTADDHIQRRLAVTERRSPRGRAR